MKLSVVTPTYNEAGNIERFICELRSVLEGVDYEIIVSDDDSPDHTWAKVQEIGRRDPRVRCLRRTANRGLSAAVIDGFSVAKGDFVACIDADLQHDPAALVPMLRQLETGGQLAVGTRYMEGGGVSDWGLVRQAESWLATKLAQVMLRVSLRDPMSGFFMLRRDDFLLVRDKLSVQGFKILLELAAVLQPRDVREVPYTFRARVAGESKLSGRVVLAFLRQLWRLSPIGRVLPGEFIRYALTGGIGVVINLAVLSAIFHFTAYRDWRASALASVVAMANNYLLNNFWTFAHRSHRGLQLAGQSVLFMLVSCIGLAITTGAYALFSAAERQAFTLSAHPPEWALLLAQFLAILAGTYSNYSLNRSYTWPHRRSAVLLVECEKWNARPLPVAPKTGLQLSPDTLSGSSGRMPFGDR